MTPRQLELLRLLREDLTLGKDFMRRMITAEARELPVEERVSWDEFEWVSAFRTLATLGRIEAARIVADVRQRTIDDAITARIEADRRVVNG